MGWDFSSVFYKLLITDLLNNFFLKHRESGTRLALSGMRACLLLKRVQNIWTRGTSPRVRFLMSHSKESREKMAKQKMLSIFGLETCLHMKDCR